MQRRKSCCRRSSRTSVSPNPNSTIAISKSASTRGTQPEALFHAPPVGERGILDDDDDPVGDHGTRHFWRLLEPGFIADAGAPSDPAVLIDDRPLDPRAVADANR